MAIKSKLYLTTLNIINYTDFYYVHKTVVITLLKAQNKLYEHFNAPKM